MDPEALEAAREARKQRRIALKEQRIADAANSLAGMTALFYVLRSWVLKF